MLTSLNKRATYAIVAISVILSTIMLFFALQKMSTGTIRDTDLYANNWSGYSAVSSDTTFDSISASWTVPEVKSTPAPGYSAVWIGIGGILDKSNKLIQAGTEEDIQADRSKNYYAWVEALPRPAINIGSVLPGDLINVKINKIGNSQSTWHVTLSRESRGIVTTLIENDLVARANSASRGSAEFIVEAPTAVSGSSNKLLPLADFGSVTFTNCTTNIGDLGSLKNIYKFTMTNDGTREGTRLATPGPLLSNDSFDVDWHNQ